MLGVESECDPPDVGWRVLALPATNATHAVRYFRRELASRLAGAPRRFESRAESELSSRFGSHAADQNATWKGTNGLPHVWDPVDGRRAQRFMNKKGRRHRRQILSRHEGRETGPCCTDKNNYSTPAFPPLTWWAWYDAAQNSVEKVTLISGWTRI